MKALISFDRVRSAVQTGAALGILLASVAGCSNSFAGRVTIDSSRTRHDVVQSFPAAYCANDASGGTDIVLVDNAANTSNAGGSRPCPVRQVMHIRVLWMPTRDSKADHTSASNATVHWYLIGNTPASSGDVIEYSGTAMVILEATDGGREVSIRSASLQLAGWRGPMRDPIGPSTFKGAAHATDDFRRVRQVLSDLRAVVAKANQQPQNLTLRNVPGSPSSLVR